ncbi:MAG: MOSC domain-containing protein [Archangium sp.]
MNRVVGLAVCRPREVGSQRVDSLFCGPLGIEGDRHSGATLISGPRQKGVPRGTVLPNTRQVSLVSLEESAQVATSLGIPRLDMTWLAANVELEWPALSTLGAGARLKFSGGVVLALEGENEPCRKVGKLIAARTGLALESKFVKAAWGLRGVVGWVETPGRITLGEKVALVP